MATKEKKLSWAERFARYTPPEDDVESTYTDVLPFGLLALDIQTKGGLPTGITRISSEEGLGKSALAQMACAQAVSLGIPVLWVDAESRFDPEVAAKNGMNPKDPLVNVMYIHDEDGKIMPYEEIVVMIELFIREYADSSPRGVIVVVDSLDACRTAAQLASVKNETITDANMASQAKINTNWIYSLSALLRAKKSRIIFIQQLKANMNVNTAKFDPWRTNGGEVIKYQARLTVFLAPTKTLAIGAGEDREMTGRRISAKIKKSGRGMGKRAKYDMLVDFGPDYIGSALEEATKYGVLTKQGKSELLLDGVSIGKTDAAQRRYMIENPLKYYDVYDRVMAIVNDSGIIDDEDLDDEVPDYTDEPAE